MVVLVLLELGQPFFLFRNTNLGIKHENLSSDCQKKYRKLFLIKGCIFQFGSN